MSSINTNGRRDFLSSFGVASAAVLAHNVVSGSTLQGGVQRPSDGSGPRIDSEYLLAAGLAYLNTAALGPSPRSVLNRTLEAWYQLESNPVQMAYGEGAVHLATDRVREQAAAFLGCVADELLITRSTTDAMNTLALGMHLRAGDRVLMTNHEHEGAEHCWTHLAARQGIAIDVATLPMTEYDPSSILKHTAAGITPNTRVISVSHVLTSNGVRISRIMECRSMRRPLSSVMSWP